MWVYLVVYSQIRWHWDVRSQISVFSLSVLFLWRCLQLKSVIDKILSWKYLMWLQTAVLRGVLWITSPSLFTLQITMMFYVCVMQWFHWGRFHSVSKRISFGVHVCVRVYVLMSVWFWVRVCTNEHVWVFCNLSSNDCPVSLAPVIHFWPHYTGRELLKWLFCVCAHITIQDDSEQNSHIHKNGLTSLTQHLRALSCFESAPLTERFGEVKNKPWLAFQQSHVF